MGQGAVQYCEHHEDGRQKLQAVLVSCCRRPERCSRSERRDPYRGGKMIEQVERDEAQGLASHHNAEREEELPLQGLRRGGAPTGLLLLCLLLLRVDA